MYEDATTKRGFKQTCITPLHDTKPENESALVLSSSLHMARFVTFVYIEGHKRQPFGDYPELHTISTIGPSGLTLRYESSDPAAEVLGLTSCLNAVSPVVGVTASGLAPPDDGGLSVERTSHTRLQCSMALRGNTFPSVRWATCK